MTRWLGGCGLLLLMGATAAGHFVYVVPNGPETNTGKVIFSDQLKPDDRVNVAKLDSSQVQLRVGTESEPLAWEAHLDEGYYAVKVPGKGSRMVTTVTDYGVLVRGDDAFWLKYYAKGMFGPLPQKTQPIAAEEAPLELVPVIENGKLRVQSCLQGKPYPNVELSILTPDEEEASLATSDDEGMSPAFEESGLYGFRVRHVDATPGIRLGQQYQEVRHYATLTLYFQP